MGKSGKLKLRRYRQRVGECAVAAAATVANYYNTKVNYRVVSGMAQNDGEGMFVPDIGILLNRLGFGKVTVITADIDHFDFAWKGYDKDSLLKEIRHRKRYNRDAEEREYAGAYLKFLTDESNDNSVIIDHHFGGYIRDALDAGTPLLLSFNFNLFHELEKWNDAGDVDPHKGVYEQHEVALCGYDDHGVSIVDSHHQLYTGRLGKYRNGRYIMAWESLMTAMGFGDVIIPTEYSAERFENGLV